MIVLDTDHLSVLANDASWRAQRLADRLMEHHDNPIATTIVCVEESLRGWLADIHRSDGVRQQQRPYDRLCSMIEFLADWTVLRLEDASIAAFEELRRQRVRVAPQDLKIASITLSNNALLLSANLKDFEKVPGLRVENWLESMS